MKRKFFSLMVAACAALFSFSGLTGCSGGGGSDDETHGIVTLPDFAQGRKGYMFHFSVGTIEVTPIAGAVDNIEGTLKPGDKDEDAYAVGTRKVYCRVNGNLEAYVSYCISGWSDGHPADGEADGAGVTSTGLLISFAPEFIEKASRDPNLLKALGLEIRNEHLSSDIKIGIQSKTGSCDASVTATHVDNVNDTIERVVAPTGTYSVVKH